MIRLEISHDSCPLPGWRGLYRGNATNVLRSAPQKALDFFAFDVFKVGRRSVSAEVAMTDCRLTAGRRMSRE